MKVHKEKRYDRLVDEEDEEPQLASEPQEEDDEYNLQRGIQMSLESFQAPVGGVAIHEPALGITQRPPVVEGKGKGIATDEQDDTSANVVRDTLSPTDAETRADTENSNCEGDTKILNVDEKQGKNVSKTVALEERTIELDEGQARSDLGNTLKSQPLPDEDQGGSNPRQSHVVLAGPNPKPMHEDFIVTVYPQVYESLKHITKKHVHIENSLSSSETLSSMKNLDDAFTFGDQFPNDKPTEEDPGKAKMETEVESMVTVPILQASSSAPPLSNPIIDLTHPKPDKTTQALSSRVFTLENHDLYSKINNYVNETVKEAVQNALQAPVHERFKELWTRNIVIKKHVEDLQLGIESYQTKLNLTQLNWDATDFLFKEDYTIIHKSRAVIYRDRNNQKKMMMKTEVHKFSNDTLMRILEKLDVMVKDYVMFKFNLGMEHRIWSEDDKRRSQEFIKLIQRRLKIRRIFRSLESFVSGRLRDVNYRLIQRTE
ncbi:hypothetical protein Tco_0831258 [Tanacetum coccineum]